MNDPIRLATVATRLVGQPCTCARCKLADRLIAAADERLGAATHRTKRGGEKLFLRTCGELEAHLLAALLLAGFAAADYRTGEVDDRVMRAAFGRCLQEVLGRFVPELTPVSTGTVQ